MTRRELRRAATKSSFLFAVVVGGCSQPPRPDVDACEPLEIARRLGAEAEGEVLIDFDSTRVGKRAPRSMRAAVMDACSECLWLRGCGVGENNSLWYLDWQWRLPEGIELPAPVSLDATTDQEVIGAGVLAECELDNCYDWPGWPVGTFPSGDATEGGGTLEAYDLDRGVFVSEIRVREGGSRHFERDAFATIHVDIRWTGDGPLRCEEPVSEWCEFRWER